MKKMKNFWQKLRKLLSNGQELEEIKKEAEDRDKLLKAQILELSKLVYAIAGGLYSIELYKLGPNLPEKGRFERLVLLSDVPTSLHGKLLLNREAVAVSGINPVSWSGSKWVLKEK